MELLRATLLVLVLVSFEFGLEISSASPSQSYIVYLGSSPETVDKQKLVASHQEILRPVFQSLRAAQRAIFYSYTHGFNGFAAKLRPEQAADISRIPGVLSVFPNKENYLHTTHSWDFMQLESQGGEIPASSLWSRSNFGKDVIIGSLDTGIWPESESLNDESFDAVPSKWKGKCVSGTAFNTSHCNRKLIGARYYIKGFELENGPLNVNSTGDFKSPRDKKGHGTHTSSIAGGRFVPQASFLGLGNGTAKGGAPLARLAVYKVCWQKEATGTLCYDADILAAMDDAIQDGVDILTLSLGGSQPLSQLFQDAISIGAYHAVQKGIPVVCSAGNGGPAFGSVVNVAPWVLTVAASSTDRDFCSTVVLGDNSTFRGSSMSEFKLEDGAHQYPLISGGAIPASSSNASDSLLCNAGSLDPEKAKGKIVVCLRGSGSQLFKGQVVQLAGGVGMILANSPSDGSQTQATFHVLPATNVNSEAAAAIFAYLNASSSPTATLTASTTVTGIKPAPTMAPFSSRGPNMLIPDILKPDVTAPGVNILASFSEAASPITNNSTRALKFFVASGTSMACPHVSGVASMLKALYPEWSPAAIMSAIVTTARSRDNREQLILADDSQVAGAFNFGSGHVDPNAAADPGLVYDAAPQDYLLLLCSLKFNTSTVRKISGQDNFSCPVHQEPVSNFNYPSIGIARLNANSLVSVTRTLTSVANCSSTYEAFVRPPPGVSVSVWPSRLTFSGSGQKQQFAVSFKLTQPSPALPGGRAWGYMVWSDGKHQVRSSIAIASTGALISDA
ncbi:subtilisin-like protease SBT5.3 isoform X2 [Selaginella moellendorffii]|uniref:subtilisin-like protease SBT5.3 isoform X2 n=1 Tax=Selaginella moellendorffii TaxID=88036 RepID=UPI000D1C47DB|nr:subtilisin-like protease SBT5.3 isoform X2 [Selaginella moellendorffii]|eukprot:XP_024524941.1 subtilisin-like protease SBT5.3 isoform X2 [Selaginella moellendorffii]